MVYENILRLDFIALMQGILNGICQSPDLLMVHMDATCGLTLDRSENPEYDAKLSGSLEFTNCFNAWLI